LAKAFERRAGAQTWWVELTVDGGRGTPIPDRTCTCSADSSAARSSRTPPARAPARPSRALATGSRASAALRPSGSAVRLDRVSF